MAAASLRIGGDLVQDALLASVEIVQELNAHWWCTIDCRQTEDKRFPAEECLGRDVQVFTLDQNGDERVLFDGFILDVELTYEIWGSFSARLSAVTRSYLMDLTPRQEYYAASSLVDLASLLVANVGLSATVQAPSRNPLNYVQWGETDFRFLARVVDDYGCWLRPSALGLEILDTFQAGPTVKWRDEEGLVRFRTKGTLTRPTFSGAHYNAAEMRSETFAAVAGQPEFFDSVSKLVTTVSEQSKSLMPPGYLYQRSRVATLEDCRDLLVKESARSLGASITGHGESRRVDLRPGNQIAIEGVLDCSGSYGVTRVVHRWTPQGYVNEFTCTPWKTYSSAAPPPMRRWDGMVSARVIDHNDPENMGRLQVQYYWQENSVAHWARMTSIHAGADRGVMFIPEKGDEVLVAFEDGDLERPIVIGSLWNGVDRPPRDDFWGGELPDNDVKRIVTKSGHRMQFVDKQGKEAIVLATPKHLKVSLIESTDETGRSMLTLHSDDGDILLSAPNGRIHCHSKFFSRDVG